MATGAKNTKGASKNKQKTVKIDIQTETKDALIDIKRLDKKLKTLGNISKQGSGEQKGLLTRKQVKLYKTILGEMEDAYKTHYDKLSRFEKEQVGKIDNIRKEIDKRQKLLYNAKGGNRWGDVASPKVVAHHERKLKEAIEDYAKLDIDGVKEKLASLKDAVDKLSHTKNAADQYTQKIDSLHQENPVIQSISEDLL